ncbi:MAG: tetratricopeptide repeat protein [Theionarchaea archaeon]|nr:tetratricopeptide repeat protein [Theionarchaea archaeon]MBU7038058.1 tetratricopeptide repeat protein [Theionarchaea archaeon]
MRVAWLLCLCALMAQSLPDPLVLDSFESQEGWDQVAAEGCSIRLTLDRMNSREGQASIRIEAQFPEGCEEGRCYAGMTRRVSGFEGYHFFRFWIKPDAAASNAVFAIHLAISGGREGFCLVPLDQTGWHLVTVSFTDFESDKKETISFSPGDIEAVSLLLASNKAMKTVINVDELLVLQDSNGNGIPDKDETNMLEAARNSEQMADRYYENEDYEKARKYYEETRSLYQKAGNAEKAQEMDKNAKQCVALLEYEQAEESYAQEDYASAMEAYERARREFVLLGDLDMVGIIEERLGELSALTGKPTSPPPARTGLPPASERPRSGGAGGLFLVLLLVAVVGGGVYMWKFRKPAQPEPEKETEPALPSEGKAEEIRKLKARFVYGEITRKDYEKKLRELEGES